MRGARRTRAGRDLRVTTNACTFTGRVRDDPFAFDGPARISFAKPSTRDVLFRDGVLAAPDDGTTGPVAAVPGAGFDRPTLPSHPGRPAPEDGRAYGFASCPRTRGPRARGRPHAVPVSRGAGFPRAREGTPASRRRPFTAAPRAFRMHGGLPR